MLSYRQITILGIFVILNTIMSVSQWCIVPIGNTYLLWGVNIILICLFAKEASSFGSKLIHANYLWPSLYLVWAIIGIIRSIQEPFDYWMYKQLMTASFSLMLPLVVYAFSDEEINQRVCKMWNFWMVPVFVILFVWNLSPMVYHFLLWPIFFYAIFAKYLPYRWLIAVSVLFFIMLSFGILARAQAIKVVMSIALSLAFFMSGVITEKCLKLLHWFFYVAPIVLLYLGLTGQYNVFEDLATREGEYVAYEEGDDGEMVEVDASDDTRTFIYYEVVSSAILNDYIWAGRTPARGNDSETFGKVIAKETGVNRWERPANEMCHPNIFTWLGMIGVILYSLIYLSASWMAIYRSRSFALKVLGCFVAFHWAVGWFEDMNRFSVDNIFLWMCIAMCLSGRFRDMEEAEFCLWFKGIFHRVSYNDIEERDDETDEEEFLEEETSKDAVVF